MELPAILKISNDHYHAMDGISKSGWYKFALSALEYEWNLTHPQPATSAMDLGTIAHSVILEDKNIEDVAVKQPLSISRRTTSKVKKDGTRTLTDWEKFTAANTDKIILKAAEWENVKGMVEAVKKHPRYEELLTGGVAEQSFFWKNEEYGFLQKCRPDYLPGNGIITSLKTTASAHPWKFGKVAGDKRYHWSAVLETTGVSICTRALHDRYYHFVVESEPPHQTVVYEHYGADLDAGQQQLEILYPMYAECLKTGEWLGYKDGFLHMPQWATYVSYDELESKHA